MVLRIPVLKHLARNPFNFRQKHVLIDIEDMYNQAYVKSPRRLTPHEINTILKANEFNKEFTGRNSVKSYDSNQLASNKPIEDYRAEAKCTLTNGLLFGVFDGHGGDACSQVVCKRLLSYIAVSLLPPDILKTYSECKEIGNANKILESYNDKLKFIFELQDIYERSLNNFVMYLIKNNIGNEFQMETAIQNAFLRLDNDISEEAILAKGRNQMRALSVAMSGAVAAVAHIDGPHLHVANSGDCQVAIGVFSESDGWSVKMMTEEHNTDNQAEVKRILSEHPEMERQTVIKMERLLGQLAPLRSIGDFRYKWNHKLMNEKVVRFYGEHAVPPHYYTPPYLTAKPQIKYHKLTPQDKFIIIASDGLWDLMSPIEAVRLVGEHMSGKMTLSPLRLPQKDMKLSEINEILRQRKEGLKKEPMDVNAATHLIRNALCAAEYGLNHNRMSIMLTLPRQVVRLFRDDITITVIYTDTDYLKECPA